MLWAAFLARRLGPTGWLGIAALVAAGMLVLGVNPMLERLNAATAAQVEDANRHLSQLRDPAFARAHGDPTAALLASLPAAKRRFPTSSRTFSDVRTTAPYR